MTLTERDIRSAGHSADQRRLYRIRSRLFDYWSGLLPKDVCRWQVAFELAEMVRRAKAQGAKNRELSEFLSVSQRWITTLMRDHQSRWKRHSPVEIYLLKLRSDLFRLTGKRPWSMVELRAREIGIQHTIARLEDRLTLLRTELTAVRTFEANIRRLEETTPALQLSDRVELVISRTDDEAMAMTVPFAWALESLRPSNEPAIGPPKEKSPRTRPRSQKLPSWLNPKFPEPRKHKSKT